MASITVMGIMSRILALYRRTSRGRIAPDRRGGWLLDTSEERWRIADPEGNELVLRSIRNREGSARTSAIASNHQQLRVGSECLPLLKGTT